MRRGFTLVEAIVVAGIFATIALISYFNFQQAQLKTRDLQRKNDLGSIVDALDRYFLDFGVYPPAENGKIVGCGPPNFVDVCEWVHGQFGEPEGTIYLSRVPGDIVAQRSRYYYEVSEDLSNYKIYASLENIRDPEANIRIQTRFCGTEQKELRCNFGLASPNQSILESF